MKAILNLSAAAAFLLFIMLVTTTVVNAQAVTKKIYVKVVVDGLSCPFCAYGLEKKLKEVKGAEEVFIELADGEATFNVPANEKPSERELREIVEDAGFTPGHITFSERPFEKKRTEE